jgi:hypothetical protein
MQRNAGGRRGRPAARRHAPGPAEGDLAGGPDSVHRMLIAKNVLGCHAARESWLRPAGGGPRKRSPHSVGRCVTHQW